MNGKLVPQKLDVYEWALVLGGAAKRLGADYDYGPIEEAFRGIYGFSARGMNAFSYWMGHAYFDSPRTARCFPGTAWTKSSPTRRPRRRCSRPWRPYGTSCPRAGIRTRRSFRRSTSTTTTRG